MEIQERELVVFSITPVVEIATGDTLYQVALGESVDATSEALARTIQLTGLTKPKIVNALWLMVNVKSEVIPYRIGSKWKLVVNEDGSLSLTEISK